MRPPGRAPTLEKRRKEAVRHFVEEGWTAASVAEKFKTTVRTVFKWVKASKKKEGLDSKPNLGRPWKLDEKDIEKLEKLLLKGASKHGFDTDLWTLERVAIVIEKHFGVALHPTNVSKNLARMGWSPQQPVKKAVERDEAAIEDWRKMVWAKIKKKRAD